MRALKRVFAKGAEMLIKIISGILQRALVTLTLFISVLCCVCFIYGLYIHSEFYCLFSAIGAVVFVYVNKQT